MMLYRLGCRPSALLGGFNRQSLSAGIRYEGGSCDLGKLMEEGRWGM